ncbi:MULTISPECIES: hypothetical protein [unclassified Microcoleus]|uniref:hypothetical protein n=1 Tax=unclassified Microcoleus TaxID=2642155 RepID=UPI002FD0F6D2
MSSGGSGGSSSGGSGNSGTGSGGSGSSGGSSAPTRRIGIAIVLGGIAGGLVAAENVANIGTWLFGDSVLCKFGILKCSNPPEPRPVIPTPPTTTFSSSPSPEPIKQDPIPVSSPTSTPSPAPETPAPVSPSPTKTPEIEQKPVEPTKSSDPNIGILKESRIFSDRLTSKDNQKYYYFSIDTPSNVSLYLDNVTNEVGILLYVDTNGNKVIDSGEQIDSASAYSNSTGTISKMLGADSYIATVLFKGGNTNYTFQIINNTNDAVKVGELPASKSFSETGSLNRKNRQKYYRFTLKSTSNVSISLDQVTNEVGMWLYVDTNGNGVIDSGEQVDSASAYSNSTGTIKRSLGADDYILVVQEKGGNTNYTVNMTAQ